MDANDTPDTARSLTTITEVGHIGRPDDNGVLHTRPMLALSCGHKAAANPARVYAVGDTFKCGKCLFRKG